VLKAGRIAGNNDLHHDTQRQEITWKNSCQNLSGILYRTFPFPQIHPHRGLWEQYKLN
jgi:hypothetical protein